MSIILDISKNEINNIKTLPPYTNNIIPDCEKKVNRLLNITLIPCIRSKNRFFKYIIPFLTTLLLGTSTFSMLFYPNYYPNQGTVWSMDLAIGFITNIYLLYLNTKWELAECHENINIPKWKERLSMIFCVFFMIYWFYFAVIQFSNHSENNIGIQLLNIYMSTSWYIFFSIISVLYYFICTKLSQRAFQIRQFLKDLKKTRPSIEYFYSEYNEHHKKIKIFARYWNFIIFLGFILLTFHVPIDLLAVVFAKKYYDIPGFIIKLLALAWYTNCICYLNNYNDKIIPYLYKHKIFKNEQIDKLDKYVSNRPICLNFFGIIINGKTIIKIGLLFINLVIPTLYALFSTHIFDFYTKN